MIFYPVRQEINYTKVLPLGDTTLSPPPRKIMRILSYYYNIGLLETMSRRLEAVIVREGDVKNVYTKIRGRVSPTGTSFL